MTDLPPPSAQRGIMNPDERPALSARMSGDLLKQKYEPLTLQHIVEFAVQVVPGCDWASVSLRTARSPAQAAASTNALVHRADLL